MLVDSKGKPVNPDTLPRDRNKREKILAGLREVGAPFKGHGQFFKLQQRATLRQS